MQAHCLIPSVYTQYISRSHASFTSQLPTASFGVLPLPLLIRPRLFHTSVSVSASNFFPPIRDRSAGIEVLDRFLSTLLPAILSLASAYPHPAPPDPRLSARSRLVFWPFPFAPPSHPSCYASRFRPFLSLLLDGFQN